MPKSSANLVGERSAGDALPQPENKRYFPALDGLRAVAVLMVFTTHYGQLPPAWSWGNTGVDIFFVLSGLLITGILYDSQARPDRYRVFYIRRTLRIFPLYYAVLLVPVLLYPVFRWQLHPAQWMWPLYLGNYSRLIWQGAVQNFTYTPYDSLYSATFPAFRWELYHLWSLCVEEQFYLVWPFVVFAVARRERLLKLCVGIVVAVPLLRLLVLQVSSVRHDPPWHPVSRCAATGRRTGAGWGAGTVPARTREGVPVPVGTAGAGTAGGHVRVA